MRIQDLNKTGEAIFTATMTAAEAKLLAEACYLAGMTVITNKLTGVDARGLRELGATLRRAWNAGQFLPDGSARA